MCDGSVIEQEDYPELFEVLAGNYGIISREEIRLPDLRGKVTVGKDSSDTDFNELGKTGGEKEHTLTVSEMPKHNHTGGILTTNTIAGNARYYFQQLGATNDENFSNSLKIGEAGGNQPHNNLQPYIVTNYIIKAKMTVAIEGEIIQETGTASTTNVYSAKAIDNKLTTNITTGQEVATNEYIDGKRVYLKRATFTTPNAVDIWKTMITIPANSEIVNSYQVYEAESSKYPFPFSYNNESMQIYYNSNDGTINVKINFAYALNKDGYIIVKYTKNT